MSQNLLSALNQQATFSSRHSLMFAMMALAVLLHCMPTAQADTNQANANQTNLTINTDDNAKAITAKGDAVQTFVAAEFAKRQAMLESWTGSPESLDTLTELIETDALYTGDGGKTFLLETDAEGKEVLLSYPERTELADWPSDLSQVTLTNALKSSLIFGQAKVKLASDEPKTRLEAVQILGENLEQVDPSLLQTAMANESNSEVQEALAMLQARMALQGGTDAEKLTALDTLSLSDSPDVLVELNNALANEAATEEFQTGLLSAVADVERRITISTWTGHVFTGLSTASILLLAALGLAITFGLLGVINMAHGELIMIGAYATYVVQGLFQTYAPGLLGWYLLAAIPAAFLTSAVIGMVIERIVIRPLYGRELETLLATFGVSLILMQGVRMVFGAQNVEVSNVAWLSGAYQVTSSLSLPYNRIAIIAFTVAVLGVLIYLLNKTRFGLFVRAVTQNRQMARAVGIRSSRIDMMAFGLGSGLAGLAGCALAQVGNVGPDLGQTYIIDAFLVVVVGGVGQVWGAVLAALGLGVSGTVLEIGMGAVLAKILLLVLVILFIQKRPQGLFALKGRFVD